ncbi:MAG: hypothetical protein UU16_C0040G0005 [Candidatus Woesebacteria bacterium GW2011_GWA2_40_7]|uniref:Uncharacterized protein n=1 Tax=Candidatus Woesebacteria bacterium GW2011_GWA2_40_7 TaxID=1618562 RepID=A0A0G0WB03_9BACT|nr:MAG: hypothetical protein UU16_C0040G0005 [Candidatus Woesebacteria bacterium GW2011_GWA2_40_7]
MVKSRDKQKNMWRLVGFVFLLGAVAAGVLLVRQSQDIREKAGGCNFVNDPCSTIECPNNTGVCTPLSGGGLLTCFCANPQGGGGGGGTNTPPPGGGGSGSGAGGDTRLRSYSQCNGKTPCKEGFSCSRLFGRCFSKNTCDRYSILKCK